MQAYSSKPVRGAPETATLDFRVLILAPMGPDAILASQALRQGELSSELCSDVVDLCRKVREGAGAALIAEEAFSDRSLAALKRTLSEAPPWSDLPLILLTVSEGQIGSARQEDQGMALLGNVTFVERPIRAPRLVTAVLSALRARQRQYQLRDLLLDQQKAVERLDLLAEVTSHLLLSHQPEQLVASVFRKIAAHLGLEVYLSYLLDEERKKLRLCSHAGVPDAFAAENEWRELRHSFCGTAAEQQKRVVAEKAQISADPALAHIKELGVTAYACFPLVANGRLIGTLSFGVRRRDRLEHEEVAMLDSVCNQVAVAIERKRTEEALHDLNQLLETRVQERTAQLQEINDQMEAFTYSISHDLRAPLRAIRGFAQALEEDYSPSLDATGRDYLARMGEGAERLDRLIQDLLQYSRLGRSTLTFDPIDLEETLGRVLQQMQPDIDAAHALVEIQRPLPRILGHEPTLEQVLSNLVSNAIKFVAPNVKPHVRIWGAENGCTARLWVADNGIGIAPAHHHRIFGVFERLHTVEAYPGTGIGLAIVAKGIARLGGTVGVESAADQGSRFWIELPRPGPDHKQEPQSAPDTPV